MVQCTLGYSLSIWPKVPTNVLNPGTNTRYVISSGGQTCRVISSGMAALTKYGKLYVDLTFKIRSTKQHWKIDDVIVNPEQWFHLIVT